MHQVLLWLTSPGDAEHGLNQSKRTSRMCGRVPLRSTALRPHRGLDAGWVRVLNGTDAGVYTR